MNRCWTLMMLVVITTCFGAGQTTNKQKKSMVGVTGDEQVLIQIERVGNAATARNDVATLSQYLADDWFYQGPGGMQKKAEVMAALASKDQKYDSINVSEIKVRMFGNTAVVTGIEDEKSSYKGQDTSGRYIWMDVFVKQKGRWLLEASQATPMSKK